MNSVEELEKVGSSQHRPLVRQVEIVVEAVASVLIFTATGEVGSDLKCRALAVARKIDRTGDIEGADLTRQFKLVGVIGNPEASLLVDVEVSVGAKLKTVASRLLAVLIVKVDVPVPALAQSKKCSRP